MPGNRGVLINDPKKTKVFLCAWVHNAVALKQLLTFLHILPNGFFLMTFLILEKTMGHCLVHSLQVFWIEIFEHKYLNQLKV